jgi:signal transduction histidine kinase
MNISFRSYQVKYVLVSMLLLVVIGSFVYNHYLIEQIRVKERSSVELWAKAIEYQSSELYPETRRRIDMMREELMNEPMVPMARKNRWSDILDRAEADLANSALDFVASELIIKDRFEIPSVVVDTAGQILHAHNIPDGEIDGNLIRSLSMINEPIQIMIGDETIQQRQFVYYGESGIVRALRYYPYVQFGLLSLFLGIGYASLSSIKRHEQSKLWVGMAKESAHQLGTPLSSLLGWIALLKDGINDSNMLKITHELENDVQRLQSIAERFNKIGSSPELKPQRLGPVLEHVTDYMERRLPQISSHIRLEKDIESTSRVNMNPELLSWAVENLLKNAIDAIEPGMAEAIVGIHSRTEEDSVIIDVVDTGRGIGKKNFKEVFNPGFSTKKRGWGLGLSLSRRIVQDYHKGEIFVYRSAPGKGTTFRIILPQVLPNEEVPGQSRL